MTVFQIKIIAIAAMIIDHIGFFFFPENIWMRMIGRISFPLFAWLIANGVYHTKNIRKYGERLFLFAVISQIPFLLAHRSVDPSFWMLNILFTLFLGLIGIVFLKNNNIFVVLILAVLAAALNVDYGAFGFLLIIFFYHFFYNWKLLFIAQTALFITAYLLSLGSLVDQVQPFGLVSLLLIAFYNQKLGISAQYLFYIVYPLQYLIIYFLIT